MSALFTPQISIIVPVYNPPAPYLRECLDSICNQTLKDIEIILIDNGSIEDNPQILQDYAARDQRIKLIRFEENKGVSNAVNHGINMVSAPYFQIVDSDDLLKTQACEHLVQTVNSFHNPEIIIFDGDSIFPDSRGYVQNSRLSSDNLDIKKLFNTSIISSLEKSTILLHTTAQYWNKLFKTQFIRQKSLGLSPQLPAAFPDVLFSIQSICEAKDVIIIPESLYIYRESIGLSSKFHRADCLYCDAPLILAQELFDFMAQNKLSEDLTKTIISKGIIFHLKQFFSAYTQDGQQQYICKLKDLVSHIPSSLLESNKKLQKFAKLIQNSSANSIKQYLLTTAKKKYLGGTLCIKTISNRQYYYLLGIPIYRRKIRFHKSKSPTPN